jgi:hypothetical protein
MRAPAIRNVEVVPEIDTIDSVEGEIYKIDETSRPFYCCIWTVTTNSVVVIFAVSHGVQYVDEILHIGLNLLITLDEIRVGV